MEHYLGVAREQGITEEEIGTVQGLCMMVSAGRINSQMREVESRLRQDQEE